jgi:hypothetical protein
MSSVRHRRRRKIVHLPGHLQFDLVGGIRAIGSVEHLN